MASFAEIADKARKEAAALRKENAAADGVELGEDAMPAEWAAQIERTKKIVGNLIGLSVVGGDIEKRDGTLGGLELMKPDGKKVQLTFTLTDDGRFIPALFDMSIEPEIPKPPR